MNKKLIGITVGAIALIAIGAGAYVHYDNDSKKRYAEAVKGRQMVEAARKAERHEVDIIQNYLKLSPDANKFKEIYDISLNTEYINADYSVKVNPQDKLENTLSVYCQLIPKEKMTENQKLNCQDLQRHFEDSFDKSIMKQAKALAKTYIVELRKKYPELNQQDIVWEPLDRSASIERAYKIENERRQLRQQRYFYSK